MPWKPADWPIPRPRIAHLMPYLRGDSLKALWVAAKILFIRWVDQNVQCTADDYAVVLHWRVMEKNGYEWRWTGRYVRHNGRKVEEREQVDGVKDVNRMRADQVLRYRTKKYGGRRPQLLARHMRRAKVLKRNLAAEVKGSTGFRRMTVWHRMAADADATGVHMAIMTLTDIPGWKTRCENALKVGFPVAVLQRDMSAADRLWCRQRGIALW